MAKKILIILMALLMLVMLNISSFASSSLIVENPPITVKYSNPTIDGNISASEGWSDVAYLNETTGGHFHDMLQFTSTTDLYFAYSETGLYFGAIVHEGHAGYTLRFYDDDGRWVSSFDYIDSKAGEYTTDNYPEKTPDGTVIEGHLVPPEYNSISPANAKNAFWYSNSGNTNVYSTGEDDIDGDFSYNGDVISLTIDPRGLLEMEVPNEKNLAINIGVFGGDSVKISTGNISNNDLTPDCKAAGSLTDDTITVEVLIPWDVLCDELNDTLAYYDVDANLTVDDLISKGVTHRACVEYVDRYYNEETEEYETWGKFATVCNTCADGTPAGTFGVVVKTCGLKLVMEGKPGEEETTVPETTTEEVTTITTTVEETTTKAETTTKETPEVTTANKDENKEDVSSSKLWLIAPGIGVVAIVVIIIINFKKKKNAE